MKTALLAFFSLIFFLSPSLAQPQRDKLADAKKYFSDGKSAFDRGEYEKALADFQRADALAPAPNLSYNIGNCYERLGRFPDAAVAFERYLLQKGPPAPGDADEIDFQEKLKARIEANRKRGTPSIVQPQPVYPIPQQPYYAPYVAPPIEQPLSVRLADARRHRRNGITLMAVGLSLDVVGIAMMSTFALFRSNENFGIVGGVGALFFVTGITLWAPGAAAYVRWNKSLRALEKEKPVVAPPPLTVPPPQPHTFLFQSPTLHF